MFSYKHLCTVDISIHVTKAETNNLINVVALVNLNKLVLKSLFHDFKYWTGNVCFSRTQIYYPDNVFPHKDNDGQKLFALIGC